MHDLHPGQPPDLLHRTCQAGLWRNEQRYNALFRDIFDPDTARFHYPAGMRQQVMAFYVGGITAVIAAWLKEDCRQTPDEIIRIIETCIFPREQGLDEQTPCAKLQIYFQTYC